MPDVRPERVRVLHITYDGLLEPLGRSQVASYALRAAASDLSIDVLSFEKRDDLKDGVRRAHLEKELLAKGITWIPFVYHRAPPVLATLWDVLRGAFAALRLARRRRPSVVHARSYVAGLMALAVKAFSGARLLFDMRGFWPEERLELGLFRSQGALYRASKVAERVLLEAADHVVVLTESAKAILREREASRGLASGRMRETPITVVPCCVDLDRYRPLPRDLELAREHGLESSLVIGNIGAFNQRYLTEEMFRFAFHLKAHRPDLRFVYLTAQDASAVRKSARDAGLGDDDTLVLRVAPSEVPRWLSLFRVGVFFLRPSYAAKGSCFTKLGEFLACGVPVVTNTGVGDLDRILGAERSGLLLPGLTDRDLAGFARKALPLLEGDRVPEETARSCRETAQAHFALEEGVRRYRSVYESLLGAPRPATEVAAEVG